MTKSPQSIVVIGAGILGASMALRLSETGAKVTLIDTPTVGGNASECSFGWVNASHGNPRPYFDLRHHAMGEWDVLKDRFPDLPLHQNGTLYLHYDVDASTHLKEHLPWGYDLEAVDHARVNQLEPALRQSYSQGVLAPKEARLNVAAAAKFLLSHGKGVTRKAARVLSLRIKDGTVVGVETDNGTLDADQVVLAAGAGSVEIAKTIGVTLPIETPVGLLARSNAMEPLIHHTLLLEGLHVQQRRDGSFLAGADFGGGAINDDPERGAVQLLERIRSALNGTEKLSLDGYTQGRRPTPIDGLPIIGRPNGVEGLYVMVMHSGATLAAGVSALAMTEMCEDIRDPLLDPFGVDRF